jgi:hypothetical protein
MMPEYELQVADATRPLGDDGYFLDSLQVSYGRPRELRFGERTDHTSPSLEANQPVVLRCDGVIRFRGVIEDIDHVGRPDGEGVTYVARGPRAQAAGIFPVNSNSGFPIYIWSSATLAEMIDALVRDARDELIAAGAMADVDDPVVGVPPDLALPIGGRIAGLSFDQAVQTLLGYFDALRVIVEPDTLGWRVLNVLQGDVHTVTIGQDVVLSNVLAESIAGRFTAVRVTGRAVSGTIVERSALTPAWDASLQDNWTIDHGFVTPSPGTTPPRTLDEALRPQQLVYRRWSFADFANDLVPSEPVRLLQKVRLTGSETAYVEVRMAGPLDWGNHFVHARYPCPDPAPLKEGFRPNWRIPGKANPPMEMALQYTKRIYGEAPGVRCPATGYEGTAYTRYGLKRELIVDQKDRATVERCQQLLDAHKDVVYEGDLPVAGPVPAWLWNLGVRVNIAARGRTTGLENLAATVTGMVHEFAAGGRTTLQLSTDRSVFLAK